MNRLLAVVVVLALATPVMAEQIQNGSFEDSSGGTAWVTSIADWTLAPSTTVAGQTAGSFFGMGGYSPTDGSKFGVFSNNGGVSQTVSTASFKITNARVDFDWIYITENALGDTTHKDPFTVTLTTTDSMGAVSSTTWTVSDVDDSNLAAGSVGNSPWSPSATTYDTGEWQTFSIAAGIRWASTTKCHSSGPMTVAT